MAANEGRPKARNHGAAWDKGYEARLMGKPLSACPYTEKKARPHANAWRAGWDMANKEVDWK